MTIDGKNIRDYGCTLIWDSISAQYNLSSVLKYPNRTAVQFRNWAEADGISPDLSEFNVEEKKVQLKFLMEAGTLTDFWSKYRTLLQDITVPKPHVFDFDEIGTFTYRYDTNSAYQHPVPFNAGRNLSVFMLDFIEDKPSICSAVPSSSSAPLGQYRINGYDLGEFGMHVEDGTDDLLKYPAAKNPFTDGKNVDLSTIRMSHKEVKLSLWQLAKSKAEFLNNRAAFWNQFSNPGETDLYFNHIDASTGIYYTGCDIYTLENWGDTCAARFAISIVIPVVTWADGGGTIYLYGLWDDDFGFICDEDDSILIVG
ncbi:MAG: hypothetical protein PHE09_10475 [Oscillospiraceae bacterium]|nr:hypothetical protein [Oscillospiraceae bacterium]